MLKNKIFYHFGNKQISLTELQNRGYLKIDDHKIYRKDIILMEQTHSAFVQIVKNRSSNYVPRVDALITKSRGVFLTVKTADCIPILIYDAQKMIAAIHAGREGVKKNIVEKVCNFFQKSRRKETFVILGPAIFPKHYKVDEQTFSEFVNETNVQQKFPQLDLKKVVLQQLLSCGIPDSNIQNYPICTWENENYFSYRRNRTTKRQVSLIAML